MSPHSVRASAAACSRVPWPWRDTSPAHTGGSRPRRRRTGRRHSLQESGPARPCSRGGLVDGTCRQSASSSWNTCPSPPQHKRHQRSRPPTRAQRPGGKPAASPARDRVWAGARREQHQGRLGYLGARLRLVLFVALPAQRQHHCGAAAISLQPAMQVSRLQCALTRTAVAAGLRQNPVQHEESFVYLRNTLPILRPYNRAVSKSSLQFIAGQRY